MDRNHQPMALGLSHKYALHAFQRSPLHLHRHPFAQVWVGVIGKIAGHEGLDRVDLRIRNRLGALPSPDETDHSGHRLNSQMVRPGEPSETVSRKQWDLDFLLPVLPLAEPEDGWKQVLNALRRQPIPHEFFMSGTRADGVPVWNSVGFRHSFALSLTVRTIPGCLSFPPAAASADA